MSTSRGVALQVAVGIATAVVSSVLAALLIDAIRARRERAPLPQPVAPGADTA